jgi:citrate synthase
MEQEEPKISEGLKGVYITKSSICKVDGEKGKLYFRGYSIESLAKNSTYEEVCYLLLYGKLPTRSELDDFTYKLREERDLPKETLRLIKKLAEKTDPNDLTRTAISSLSVLDKETTDNSKEANIQRSIKLISKTASIVGAISRYRTRKRYVKPDMNMTHAQNILYMISGKRPLDKASKLMDTMLILHAEHSTNASTFATLVTASTLAGIYSAVTAGVSALKGPLHGGADEAALEMMKEIGDPNNTEKFIEDELSKKERVMGFGHRVYKTYDPRARILKEYLENLQNDSNDEVKKLTQIAMRAEKLMVEKLGASHGIWPNVDFFAGPIYTWLGIPHEIFDPIFAASRMVGWCAHTIEYLDNNVLFRPLEEYIGKEDLEYIPINNRV